jgi:hypothetical protein
VNTERLVAADLVPGAQTMAETTENSSEMQHERRIEIKSGINRVLAYTAARSMASSLGVQVTRQAGGLMLTVMRNLAREHRQFALYNHKKG